MANSEARYALDLERLHVAGSPPVPLPTPIENLPPVIESPPEEASTVCFVCLDSHRQGQYVVQVQCLKRWKETIIARKRIKSADDESRSHTPFGTRSNTPSHPTESPKVERVKGQPILETDSTAVYTRMGEACFQHIGRWRKWLPFYGVVNVTEVLFQFDGRLSHDGRYYGLMTSVDTEKAKQDCQQAIQNVGWRPEEGFEAKARLNRISLRYLLTIFARDPSTAHRFDTLSGMVHDSCIYPKFGKDRVEIPSMDEPWDEPWRARPPFRALHYEFGWQMDRIKVELPYLASVGVFGIGLVWLIVLLSRGAGFDWNGALALGQVVAASVAILITSLWY